MGGLELDYEKTLFEYDSIPLLFMCGNGADKYLCLCNSIYNGFRWIITKTTIEILSELIDEKISIYEAFEKSGEPYYLAMENYDGFDDNFYYRLESFENLKADDELPDTRLKLEF